MVVHESPEIAAVVRRIGEAWGARDFETYSSLISRSPHFRGIGSDAEEFWDSAESFLNVRRVQSEELDSQGWKRAVGTLRLLEAFEDGALGWATMLLDLQTPNGVVNLRVTAVLALEGATWKIIHWHNSVPTSNVQTFGVELTTTIDDLLNAVAEDQHALETLTRTEGTMTVVFTDIVESTMIAEDLGDSKWIDLVKDHESEIRRITQGHGGSVVKMLGDGSMLAFESARAAVRAALDIQDSNGEVFGVKIGVHAGEVVRSEGDLLGITVNKAARVASIAEGGQILLSSLVAELIGGMAGVDLGHRRSVSLRGLSGTHEVVSITRESPTERS